MNSNWSVRELKRQINTSLYEWLSLSNGEINKQEVLKLSTKGIKTNELKDMIKDSYDVEFLGTPENTEIWLQYINKEFVFLKVKDLIDKLIK